VKCTGSILFSFDYQIKMLQRTLSMYPGTPEMAEFRQTVFENANEGWGSAIPFKDGNGSYNSDDQNRLTEFNAHWYSYSHKYYRDWELTFRSLVCHRGDNAYANYSSMGVSFEDMSRFFWTGMTKDARDEFLNKVYFSEYYKDLELFEDDWEISNNYRERTLNEE
jgi:hypothetical protein